MPGKSRWTLPVVIDFNPEGYDMIGRISSLENHGSIVLVWLDLEDGTSEAVYMEHRAFGWMVEGEGCEPDDLIGRPVCYDGEVIEFLDTLEVA